MYVKVITKQASCDILPPVTQTGETHERIHSKIMSSVLATAKGRQSAFCSHMKGAVSLVSRHKNSKSKDLVTLLHLLTKYLPSQYCHIQKPCINFYYLSSLPRALISVHSVDRSKTILLMVLDIYLYLRFSVK